MRYKQQRQFSDHLRQLWITLITRLKWKRENVTGYFTIGENIDVFSNYYKQKQFINFHSLTYIKNDSLPPFRRCVLSFTTGLSLLIQKILSFLGSNFFSAGKISTVTYLRIFSIESLDILTCLNIFYVKQFGNWLSKIYCQNGLYISLTMTSFYLHGYTPTLDYI